ncbi:MAG: family 20 glycosylhydrolase [Acidobacteriaceae bacterium]|nr:family 20 glycosylhydrolase [Acidobacteriaceae bacterium]
MKIHKPSLLNRVSVAGAMFAVAAGSATLPLMPWPASVTAQPGSVEITTSFSISVAGGGAKDQRVQASVQRTFSRLSRQTGMLILPHVVLPEQAPTLSIVIEQRDHRPPQRLGDNERYSLEIANGRARISADFPLGALRGLETFLQLVQQNQSLPQPVSPGFSVPAVTIRDEPRFPWRGLSLDVSRHFIPADGIKRTIDGLAAVKLNVLHWHLSDDQGFRVESRRYQRLHMYGSDGLYYTQPEIRDIVAYARDRGVRIVPEFDMPGHATSWLPGYPNLGAGHPPYEIVRGTGIRTDLLDPTKNSTYSFLDGFVGEMAKLFPDEYFHIGGDEVNAREWLDNPKIRSFMRSHHIANGQQLQVYFNQRLLKIVTRRGKRMEGWDEVLQPNLPKNIVIQSWRGQESLWQAAREGYQGILSAGYYLDLMDPASFHYSVDPMKVPPPDPGRKRRDGNPNHPPPGTPADLTPDQQKLILGGEAAMWEEIADAENIDAKLWPRLAAIAERFWSPESVTDVNSMYTRLEVVNRWLEWLDLTQRSNLELMRQRLAATMPRAPLDAFSSILEPVKGYIRHRERPNMLTPFNRLVDAIPPESDAARDFRNATDAYLAGPKTAQNSEALRRQLAAWSEAATQVRPTLQANSLLNEDVSVADTVLRLCKSGQDAIAHLESNTGVDAKVKQDTLAAIQLAEEAEQPQADMLIAIAPGVQRLVEALATTNPQ